MEKPIMGLKKINTKSIFSRSFKKISTTSEFLFVPIESKKKKNATQDGVFKDINWSKKFS